MYIKAGVKVNGIRPEMLLAIMIADKVYNEFGQTLVITEITGGKHGNGSLHYVGLAIDIRTSYFATGEARIVADEIRISLGNQYDVVLESTHIHIEYQPK